MCSSANPLRVAILINTSSKHAPEVANSFISILARTSPQAEVAFYDPIVKQEYPDVSNCDLVILSGGTTDPMSTEPWVLKMMAFIKQTERAQRDSKSTIAKLLGICWGHQAICIALGGVVETMNRKPDIGPKRIILTGEGKKIFGFAATDGYYTAMEFHRRAITKPAEGFVLLAEDNEVLRSSSNMILSTQSHPELKGPLAVSMLRAAAPEYKEDMDVENIENHMMEPENGDDVFKGIVEWVAER